MNFDLKAWWHDLIDHIFKHPQAAQVLPQVVTAAASVPPAPTAAPAAPAAPPPAPSDPMLESYLHGKDGGNTSVGTSGQATDAPAWDPTVGTDLAAINGGKTYEQDVGGNGSMRDMTFTAVAGRTYHFNWEAKPDGMGGYLVIDGNVVAGDDGVPIDTQQGGTAYLPCPGKIAEGLRVVTVRNHTDQQKRLVIQFYDNPTTP